MYAVRLLLGALAIAALSAPVAMAEGGGRPHAPDSAQREYAADGDLRTPDTRDAAEQARLVRGDLRSPDTRDAAERIRGEQPTVVRTIVARSSGFDWSDAAIGAAGALGLIAIAAGAVTASGLVLRTRHP